MSSKNSKKEKFTNQKKSSAPIYIASTIVAIAIFAVIYFVVGNKDSDLASKTTASIGQPVKYSASDKLQQSDVPNKIENGKVIVTSLNTLKDKKFVWTEYKANGKRVPITAMVQPDGKVLVAVSICEPCNSERFHITGNKLICNACGSVWDLQTLKGITGGCLDYPPDALTYSIDGDNLEVPQSVLDAWQPRV
ncbi:MAG: DUF2318 domain-containing protein [Desulfitobacterium hafniense]|nr:DUF2318 domain-containing protein [Desulfitobacterium hafniense]